jgi:hypothetical protein
MCTITENADQTFAVPRAPTFRITTESTTIVQPPCAGCFAPLEALAERLGAATVLVIHTRNGVFKAGNTVCFSNNLTTLAWCRINAVET